MTRVWREPPERLVWKPGLYHEHTVQKANLRSIEQTIVVLLATPGEWFVVDQFRGHTGMSSGVRNALWRRGFEVVVRAGIPEHVEVWARWTHPVPSEVTR